MIDVKAEGFIDSITRVQEICPWLSRCSCKWSYPQVANNHTLPSQRRRSRTKKREHCIAHSRVHPGISDKAQQRYGYVKRSKGCCNVDETLSTRIPCAGLLVAMTLKAAQKPVKCWSRKSLIDGVRRNFIINELLGIHCLSAPTGLT